MTLFLSRFAGLTIRFGPGKVARFEGGRFATEDEEMARLLRGHPWFGTSFYEYVPRPEAGVPGRKGQITHGAVAERPSQA